MSFVKYPLFSIRRGQGGGYFIKLLRGNKSFKSTALFSIQLSSTCHLSLSSWGLADVTHFSIQLGGFSIHAIIIIIYFINNI